MADLPQGEYFGVRVARQVRLTLPLNAVESVLRVSPRQICPIPGTSPDLAGVVGQGGALIWVFDLSRFLQMPTSEDEDPPSLGVVLRSVREQLGGGRQIRRVACLVSQLEGIFALPAQPLQPLPPQLDAPLRQVFWGMGSRPIAPEEPVDPTAETSESHQESNQESNQELASPQWVRAAVLNPEALFDYLYTESDQTLAPVRPRVIALT